MSGKGGDRQEVKEKLWIWPVDRSLEPPALAKGHCRITGAQNIPLKDLDSLRLYLCPDYFTKGRRPKLSNKV